MTLIQLFTAIANAIRGKTGSSSSISAENFPQEIAGITTGKLTNEEYEEADEDVDDILEDTTVPSGTISITANGEYDVTNYINANVNVVSENNACVDTEMVSDDRIIYCITELPEFDCSNAYNMNYFFAECLLLTKVSLKNTSNVYNINYLFSSCSSLETIPTFDMSGVIYMEAAFEQCGSLTNEGLNNLLYMIANATEYISRNTNMTLKYIGLSSSQATTCTGLSNWAAAQAAGWTTGY